MQTANNMKNVCFGAKCVLNIFVFFCKDIPRLCYILGEKGNIYAGLWNFNILAGLKTTEGIVCQCLPLYAL